MEQNRIKTIAKVESRWKEKERTMEETESYSEQGERRTYGILLVDTVGISDSVEKLRCLMRCRHKMHCDYKD